MGSDSIPLKKLFWMRVQTESSLCTHAFHRTDSKGPDIHVLDSWQQKHTKHALSTKTECDYLNGWIEKNGHIYKNLTQNGEPTDIAGNSEEEE